MSSGISAEHVQNLSGYLPLGTGGWRQEGHPGVKTTSPTELTGQVHPPREEGRLDLPATPRLSGKRLEDAIKIHLMLVANCYYMML